MKKVKLKFRTPKLIWEFRTAAQLNEFYLSTRDCTIICNCNEEEIIVAVSNYNACLVEETIFGDIDNDPGFSFESKLAVTGNINDQPIQ